MLNSTFKMVFLIEVIAITTIRSIFTLKAKQRARKISIHSKTDKLFFAFEVIGMSIPLIYVLSTILDFANYNSPSWLGWIGTALFILAIIILWRSHKDLGKFWLMDLSILDDHKLINSGIYKYIRHPLYASHMIWAFAQILMLNNWIAGYSFIIVFLPHYIYRVSREEKMMISEFGNDYNRYMKETGRLFPKLIKR